MSSTSLYETTPVTGTVSSTNLTSLYSNTNNFTTGLVNSSVYSVNGGLGVTVDPTTGNVVVSIGQDVATTANVTFANVTATGNLSNNYYTLANAVGTNGQVLTTNGAGTTAWSSVSGLGLVNSVTGGTHVTASPTTGAVVVTTDATSANTASTIVSRDASGNFAASGATLGNTTVGVATDNTISTTSGNLVLDAFSGTVNATTIQASVGGAGPLGGLNLYSNDATNAIHLYDNFVQIVSGPSSSADWTFNEDGTTDFPYYKFPSADGAANTVLTTNGAGIVSWQLPGGGGSTFGNISIGVTTDNTINTTTGRLVLQSATGEIDTNTTSILSTNSATFGLLNSPTTVNAFQGATTALSIGPNTGTTNINNSLLIDDNLTVTGTSVTLASGTTIGYNDNDTRANRLQIQSTTGNTSGLRISAPNATTSAVANLTAFSTNDYDNGKFLALQATGSTTAPFSIRTGVITAGVLSASGEEINITDGGVIYASINPAGPTVGTDLTTKTYVDGLIPTVVTYDFNATTSTGGANLNLVGSNATTDTVKLTDGGGITATYTSGTVVTLGSTATSANTASAIVARDASGNFSAGTITATLSGTATQVSNSLTAGTHLSGGPFNGSSAVTLATDATDANTASTIVARDASGNFAASGATLGAVTVGVDTDNTISTSSGNLTLQTAAGVNAGTMVLTAGANGAITLAPNGTGSVALTLANGGNITNNRNYVFGAIRNATTQTTNGDIWEQNTSAAQSATNPYFRGVSIDNSADTTRGPATLLRSYSGGATAGSAQRGRVIFEKARGTSASPTAVQAGDQLGSVDATGYTSTGWLNDTVGAVPAFFGFTASENYVSNTNLGTSFTLSLAPTATTITSGANLIPAFTINPQSFASRSDAFTWANGKTGTTQTMSLDVSGNLIVTGDVRINGNDIQGSGGSSAITLTSANTATTVRGDTINLQTAASVALPSGQISYGRQYLEAYSTQDQTNPVANAENLMSFNNTGISNGVSVVTNGTTLSRITMANAGVYNIQFSAQLNQTTGGAHNAFIWLKKNGTTVANTAGDTRIAGNGDRIMAAWNYIVSASAGDYYELAWSANDTNVLLDYVAAAAPVPAIPSVILTVVPVGA